MFIRPLGATAALVLLATGCGTSGTTAQEPITSAGEATSPSSETSREEAAWVEPEPYVPPAPLEWTGAFSETAVLLADSIRIEGPANDAYLDGLFLMLGNLDCPADLDGDGNVAFADGFRMLLGWGACAAGRACPGDLDGDGSVQLPDLTRLVETLGPCS